MENKSGTSFRHSRYFVITRDYVLPVLIILSCLSVWWLALISPLFAIRSIDCQIDYHPCVAENLLTELSSYRGHNLLDLDTAAIVSRLISADFTIREAIVTRIIPHTLRLDLTSVFPVVAAKVADPPIWVIFDQELQAIGTRTVDPNVPTVTMSELSHIQVGFVPTDATLLAGLTLAKVVGTEIPTLKSLDVQGDLATLSLSGGFVGLMSLKQDPLPQIRALQAVLGNATILAGVHVIDVRFSQPVLR